MKKSTALTKIDAALMSAVDEVVNDQCCGSCSTAATHDGLTFAYYHEQDMDRAFVGGKFVSALYVGFGSNDELDDVTIVGRKIVRALEPLFDTEWDGTADRRIAVRPKVQSQ